VIIAFVAVSITRIASVPVLRAYTFLPSGLTATPPVAMELVFWAAVGIAATVAPVAASMTVTVLTGKLSLAT
jgi:hypothetical protein